jgi:hypothetical protein
MSQNITSVGATGCCMSEKYPSTTWAVTKKTVYLPTEDTKAHKIIKIHFF